MRSILIAATALLTLSSCGGKAEWETKADEYCDCLNKATEIKNSDPQGYVAKFKECQDLTTQHRQEITDKNEVFDYGKKVSACVEEAYK